VRIKVRVRVRNEVRVRCRVSVSSNPNPNTNLIPNPNLNPNSEKNICLTYKEELLKVNADSDCRISELESLLKKEEDLCVSHESELSTSREQYTNLLGGHEDLKVRFIMVSKELVKTKNKLDIQTKKEQTALVLYEKQLAVLQNKNEELTGLIKDNSVSLIIAQEGLQKEAKINASLIKRLESQVQTVVSLKVEVDLLVKTKYSSISRIAELESGIERDQSSSASLHELHSALEKNYDHLQTAMTTANDQLNRELDTYKVQSDEYRVATARLSKQIEDYKSKTEVDESKILELTARKATLDNLIVELGIQLDLHKLQAGENKIDIASLRDQIEGYESQIVVDKVTLLELTGSKATLDNHVVELGIQMDLYKMQEGEREIDIAALRERYESQTEVDKVKLLELTSSGATSNYLIIELGIEIDQYKVQSGEHKNDMVALHEQIKISKDQREIEKISAIDLAKSKTALDDYIFELQRLYDISIVQSVEQRKVEAALSEQVEGYKSQQESDHVKLACLTGSKIISDGRIIELEMQMGLYKVQSKESAKVQADLNAKLLGLQSLIDSFKVKLALLNKSKVDLESHIVSLENQVEEDKVQLDVHVKTAAAMNENMIGIQSQVEMDKVKLFDILKSKSDLESHIVRLESQIEEDKVRSDERMKTEAVLCEQAEGYKNQIEIDRISSDDLASSRVLLDDRIAELERQITADKVQAEESATNRTSLKINIKELKGELKKEKIISNDLNMSVMMYKVQLDNNKQAETILSKQVTVHKIQIEALKLKSFEFTAESTKTKAELDNRVIALEEEIKNAKVLANELNMTKITLDGIVSDLIKQLKKEQMKSDKLSLAKAALNSRIEELEFKKDTDKVQIELIEAKNLEFSSQTKVEGDHSAIWLIEKDQLIAAMMIAGKVSALGVGLL
jgi:hypothetical protein